MGMNSIAKSLAALTAAVVLVACGGGGSSESAGGMPAPQSAPATPTSPVLGPIGSPQRALSYTLTADQLLNWAEAVYAGLFSPSGAANNVSGPYTYRYYSSTNSYLGVVTQAGPGATIGDVYVLHPGVFGGQLTRVGNLTDFECQVNTSHCTVPGAPTIGTATAGTATAAISFTAPASDGGTPITQYSSTCTGGFAFTSTGTATTSPITVSNLINGTLYSCTVKALNSTGYSAASAAITVTPTASTNNGTLTGTTGGTTTTGTTTSSTSTAGVACAINSSVFIASLNLTSTAATSCSSTQRTLTGNGVPDHTPGTFPNANNPTAIAAQSVTASMTLTPTKNTGSTSIVTTGYVLNSVKLDPGTNATCTVSGTTVTCEADDQDHSGQWHIEAMGQTYMNLGLDTSNAHVQPGGIYHYHGMPEGYITRQNKGTAMTLVGFAMDGFPIYARYGYNTATDASSGTRAMVGSYRKKTTAEATSGRPSTTTYPMGTFKEDYTYDGSGDLDACNGRYGVTPEFPNGIYHYYITDTYPYIGRCVYGTATTSTTGGTTTTGTGGTGGTGGTPPPPRP
jgi:hypothetical protein